MPRVRSGPQSRQRGRIKISGPHLSKEEAEAIIALEPRIKAIEDTNADIRRFVERAEGLLDDIHRRLTQMEAAADAEG